jgi:signal transduction histidine kinase
MLAAMIAVTMLAYWDEQRESKAALDDFTQEQVTLAAAVMSSLAEQLRATNPAVALTEPPAELALAVQAIDHKGLVRVLVARPSRPDFVGADGTVVASPALASALAAAQKSVRLTRPQAAALGLPERTAVAGIDQMDVDGYGRWSVAVVATARAERDRETRAQWRLLSGVLVASGLVFAFGGLAVRKERKELELAHQLALNQMRTARDERLVQADKLATMGTLATGIVHEVSTPLGVILGRAEQLLPKQSDPKAKRAVETIAEQAERIFAVIRGFLALARGGHPELQRCNPADLARAAAALVEHRFEQGRVQLVVDCADHLPSVACDARLFEQVLVNLLLNACDACDGGGKVILSVTGDEQRAAFVVVDDGVGINERVAQRAAEPFFTTKADGKGTGLGLAIANEIIKHHRGTLKLSARSDGRGTRACVEVPTALQDIHA